MQGSEPYTGCDITEQGYLLFFALEGVIVRLRSEVYGFLRICPVIAFFRPYIEYDSDGEQVEIRHGYPDLHAPQ